MAIFTNLHIATRLAALTMVMLAILVTTGVFGMRGMSTMHEDFRAVSEDTTQALIDLSGAVDALQRVRYRTIIATMAHDPAQIAALRTEFANQSDDFDKAWSHYASTNMTGEEAGLARQTEAGLKSYRAYLARIWSDWPPVTRMEPGKRCC